MVRGIKTTGKLFTCQVCGKYFESRWGSWKFCSKKCRKKYERQQYIESKKNGDMSNWTHYCRLRFEILKRDNFTCQYCGKNPNEDDIKLHIDHIIPKSKGGKDIAENLIVSCEECNLGKSDVLLDARQELKFKLLASKNDK